MKPIVADEMSRLLALSEMNLDYTSFENNFSDLARLAAKVSGTEISLVSVIDNYTQWIISNHGLQSDPVNRDETICQYTIAENEYFEVSDLSKDDRFSDKEFVTGALNLRYYFGVPLSVYGQNVGSLCVLDNTPKNLSPEKIDLLKIIADEITNRLNASRIIESLKNTVAETQSTQNKVVHDIRGPLSGIVGLAEFMNAQGRNNKIDDVLEMLNLIQKSGNSILELADEILSTASKKTESSSDTLTVAGFIEKLYKLYTPQARHKNITLSIVSPPSSATLSLPKSKLLQIAGNLISNAIKFTPKDGAININLILEQKDQAKRLIITVADNGVGIDEADIQKILSKESQSTTAGTDGEKGYGFGLQLVNHLIKSLNGTLQIKKLSPDNGSVFTIQLPMA